MLAPLGLEEREKEILAQQVSQKSVELCEQYLGAEHLDLSWIMESFDDKRPLAESKKYDEFLRHFRGILQQWEAARGIEYYSTLKLMESLGNFHVPEKKYGEAEEIYRVLLNRKATALGPEHPDTMRTTVSLAGMLFYQNKHQEAETALRHVLKSQKRVFGVKHPETLQTMDLLMTVLSYIRYEQRR